MKDAPHAHGEIKALFNDFGGLVLELKEEEKFAVFVYAPFLHRLK